MKTIHRAALLPLVLSVQLLFGGTAKAADYAIGADLSFLKQAEAQGTVFKTKDRPSRARDLPQPRLQLDSAAVVSHSSRLPNNLEYTIALAKEAESGASNSS